MPHDGLFGEMKGSVCPIEIQADGSELSVAVLEGGDAHGTHACGGYPFAVGGETEGAVEAVFNR